MLSDEFTRRRAKQLSSVAFNGPLAGAARPYQVYGVARQPNNAVLFQFGDVRFVLERDDAIRLALLTLKYAGAEVVLGQEPIVENSERLAAREPDSASIKGIDGAGAPLAGGGSPPDDHQS